MTPTRDPAEVVQLTDENKHLLFTSVPRRRLYSYPELELLPPISYLDDDRMIVANALNLLFGGSGGGKSFYAVRIAASVSARHNKPVVYVAAEGASGYYNRMTAHLKHHKQTSTRVVFDIEPLELRSADAVTSFIETIKVLEPLLVILDTLARSMIGLDENSARDMGIAVEACARIQRETGAAVLIVHHTGKNGVRERGSSALFAAMDSVIALTNEDGLITVSCSKSKDSKPFADRCMRLVEVDIGNGQASCVLVASDRVIMRGATLTVTQKKVLETLALEPFVQSGAKAVTLQSITGASNGALYKALAALMREGYVRQAIKGDPFYIEAKGIEAIQSETSIPLHSVSSPHGTSGTPQTNSTPPTL